MSSACISRYVSQNGMMQKGVIIRSSTEGSVKGQHEELIGTNGVL